MKYRYRYIDEIVDQIEGLTDPAHKMAVIWANQDQENLKALLLVLYDFRHSFEVCGIPKYKRNRAAGMEFHSAIKLLDQRINSRTMGAGQKFKFLIDVCQQLQDRDAEILERLLQHDINLRIPLDSIQRAYPGIEESPNFSQAAKKTTNLVNLKFPATIVRQLQGPEVRVEIGNGDFFKFVDVDGNALVLPDKPNSAFRNIFKPFNNVVLSCSFQGLTKGLDKVGNTATTNASFAKFQAGELEAETISVTILDVCDNTTYLKYPAGRETMNMGFERRRAWLTDQDWGDSIYVKVSDSIEVANLEALRALENEVATTKDTLRIYGNDALWGEGFKVLDKGAF